MSATRISWIIRFTISVVVLGVLLRLVPVRELVAAFRAIPPTLWLGSLALFLVGHLIGAFKWRLLMVGCRDLTPRLWLTGHFTGLTANLCLPGVVGGDLVRAAWVMRRVGQPEVVAMASLVDRGIDAATLLVLAFVGAFWAGQSIGLVREVALVSVGLLAIGVGIVGGVYVVSRRRGFGDRVTRFVEAMRLLARRWWLPLVTGILSLTVQTLFICVNVRLGHAAGVDVGTAAWVVAWPLAKLIAAVPISLAGLGVREAALVGLMQPFGAPANTVLAAGLLWESVLVAGGLLGWLISSLVSLPRAGDTRAPNPR